MRLYKYILFFIITISSITTYGQKRKNKKQHLLIPSYENEQCIKKHNMSSTQRLNKYPFNQAFSVFVVSYNYSSISTQIINGKDTITIYGPSHLSIKEDTLSISDLEEIFLLTPIQVDSLTNILFNYGLNDNLEYNISTLCFDPHHAIVFLDKNGKVFEYIEICFLCNQYKSSSSKIKLHNIFDNQYYMLMSYFKQVGITKWIEDDQ